MNKSVSYLSAISLAVLSSITVAADLSLTVDNIRNDKGDIWVSIYDDGVAFTKQKEMEVAAMVKIPARRGSVSFTLKNLKKGDYAVSVIHDENSNAVFDQKGIIPLEGYGYSNNVGANAVPSFGKAKLVLEESGLNTSIRLIYHSQN